jgi:hypothetical protein
VTRHGSVLPIPDDPRIAELVDAWPDPQRWPMRSRWLHDLEVILTTDYVAVGRYTNSRDVNVTARSLAPFPLAEHDW